MRLAQEVEVETERKKYAYIERNMMGRSVLVTTMPTKLRNRSLDLFLSEYNPKDVRVNSAVPVRILALEQHSHLSWTLDTRGNILLRTHPSVIVSLKRPETSHSLTTRAQQSPYLGLKKRQGVLLVNFTASTSSTAELKFV